MLMIVNALQTYSSMLMGVVNANLLQSSSMLMVVNALQTYSGMLMGVVNANLLQYVDDCECTSNLLRYVDGCECKLTPVC